MIVVGVSMSARPSCTRRSEIQVFSHSAGATSTTCIAGRSFSESPLLAVGPVELLLVADQDDPLGQVRGRFAGPLRFVDGPPQAGRAIDQVDLVESLQGVVFRFVRIGAEALARAAGRDDRNLAAGGKLVDQLAGSVLGLGEQRAFERFVAHAQAVIDQDHRMQRLAVRRTSLAAACRRGGPAPGRKTARPASAGKAAECRGAA